MLGRSVNDCCPEKIFLWLKMNSKEIHGICTDSLKVVP